MKSSTYDPIFPTHIFANKFSQIIIEQNKLDFVSLITEKDSKGCIGDNYWKNSHWILRGIIDSCAFSYSKKSDEDCPHFLGTKKNQKS